MIAERMEKAIRIRHNTGDVSTIASLNRSLV